MRYKFLPLLCVLFVLIIEIGCGREERRFPSGNWVLTSGLVYITTESTQAERVVNHFSQSSSSSLNLVEGVRVPLDRIERNVSRWRLEDGVLTLNDSLRYIQLEPFNGTLSYATELGETYKFVITALSDSILELETFERVQNTGTEVIRYYSVLGFRKD